MKLVEQRPFADPDVAARKLLELAHAVEPIQDGRIHIEKLTARSCSISRQRRRNTRPA
jgi:hypothetical protein